MKKVKNWDQLSGYQRQAWLHGYASALAQLNGIKVTEEAAKQIEENLAVAKALFEEYKLRKNK